jgi:molybdenum cofactor cytidylyltransferase
MEAGAPPALRTAGLILAAGAGSRFGGDKLTSTLEGRPLVRHVVDAATRAGLDPIVVVVPPSGPVDAIDLAPARAVVNPLPAEGLSSSVRVGLRALDADADRVVDAAVILPADQPRVSADTIRALVDAAITRPLTPFVIARHRGDRTPNPVLARRSVWRLADELAGDRGFGPVLGAHPELVREISIDGTNPDVDTPDDLRRLVRDGSSEADRPPLDVS